MTTPPREYHFTTRAQATFRRGGARRLLVAAAVTALGLVLLVLLGPDEETIKRRFEYYGARDELNIMPEISIEDGQDAMRQLPQSLRQPPPAEIEIEPEELSENAEESVPVPVESEVDDSQPVPVVDTAEVDVTERVELALPMQSNPDWYILKEERPTYPVDVSESQRRTPIIFVRAAIFVGTDGLVKERMVLATNGSAAYGEAVLAALGEWQFGWRVDPGAGRWIEMTWNFRSPYFTPER